MEFVIFIAIIISIYIFIKNYYKHNQKDIKYENKEKNNIDILVEERRKKKNINNFPKKLLNDKQTQINYNTKQIVLYKLLYKNIIPYLHSKNIYKFYHFTDIKNIKSIIKYGGLYSWYGLEKRKIPSYLSSNRLSRELDKRHKLEDYVRLSFGSYHPMSSRLKFQEKKELVWLEISLDIACLKETLFSDMNATDNNVKIGNSLDFLKIIDLNVLKYNYRNLDIFSKKKYQAEILVKSFIPIKYIVNIHTIIKENNI